MDLYKSRRSALYHFRKAAEQRPDLTPEQVDACVQQAKKQPDATLISTDTTLLLTNIAGQVKDGDFNDAATNRSAHAEMSDKSSELRASAGRVIRSTRSLG